jgi:predicted  nucleic acid-binding Zn-ribbon protein
MAYERIVEENTAALAEQTAANEKIITEQANYDKLSGEIATLELDAKSLRGDEKDAAKSFINLQKMHLSNAST